MTEVPDRDATRPTVAVYLRIFLSPSETFVYRQLVGVSREVHPFVLTAHVRNAHLYPFEAIDARRPSLFDKIDIRLRRRMTGAYTAIARSQERGWRKTLIRKKAALVHAHFGHYGLDVLPLARELSLPLIVTFHGFDASRLLHDGRYVRDLAGLFRYAHPITVSEDMARRLEPFGLKRERARVHHIGVPIEEFPFVERVPIAEKVERGLPITFLQVSNFVEKKGHAFTIEAFARFATGHVGSTLILAGDGPLRPAIETLCDTHGIRGQVFFEGRVTGETVTRLMARADAFLHHSVTSTDGDMEGIPTVLMEAMSCWLPVVSTRHSGIPELIDDGVDGYLVGERDVDAYADALERLCRERGAVSRAARRKVEEKFNMTRQNELLAEIYRKVMA